MGPPLLQRSTLAIRKSLTRRIQSSSLSPSCLSLIQYLMTLLLNEYKMKQLGSSH